MIRLRFAALFGAFALLLGGYGTYVAFLRPTPAFDGATDPAHVAAVKSLFANLPAPHGTTRDPYQTWCPTAGAACWTTTTEQPKALISALTKALVSRGSKVRSHECFKPETTPIQAPQGACVAVLDYHGSRLDLTASSRGQLDNEGRSFLLVLSPMVNSIGNSAQSPALGPWATVNPLPVAWTTGATCTRNAAGGCRGYSHPKKLQVISLPLAAVCAGVRASIRGRFFFDIDEDKPATAGAQPYCEIVTHRSRNLGGKDSELVIVRATSVDSGSTSLSFGVSAD